MFVKVKVKTNAHRESVLQLARDKYEVSVKEKPAQNAANRRVLAILYDVLQVRIKNIRFVSGQKSPSKLFEIK